MARARDERVGGYLASALIFAGITALWAWIVRDDPYYSMTELLGLTLPVATVFYLTVMPGLGFIAGRWRYQADGARGAGAWLAKVFARSLHFLYAHILIVLFTAAMALDHFLGWNIDNAVRDIDDGIFDIASRFAPWVSAYLAGFNLGRVWGAGTDTVKTAVGARDEPRLTADDEQGKRKKRGGKRYKNADRVEAEQSLPPLENPFVQPETDLDPRTHKPRFSRLR